MKYCEFKKWLESKNMTINHIQGCDKIENEFQVNLDDEFSKDEGKEFVIALSVQLQKNGIGGENILEFIKVYFDFCNDNKNISNNINSTANNMVLDSYEIFFKDFNINKNKFFDWGINNTIFTDFNIVSNEWKKLKHNILNGGGEVYIRGSRAGYKNQENMYKEFYKMIFPNAEIKIDLSGNTKAQNYIQKITSLKRNRDLSNYQVSHIWGKTKNAFMYMNALDICFAPRIIDPFTDDTSCKVMSDWGEEYCKKFRNYAYNKYKNIIEDYNKLLINYNIENKINKYIELLILNKQHYSQKEINDFKENIKKQFTPIKEEI